MTVSDNNSSAFLARHRPWEDWASFTLGVIVLLAPLFILESYGTNVHVSAGFVGCMIAALAMLELISLRRWEETLEFLCGIWLIAAPFVIGYEGNLAYVHIVAGALVALLALVELWQDRNRRMMG